MGSDPQADPGLYEDLLERARELAAAKRAAGVVPPNTAEALDRLFLEVAPPGAGAHLEDKETGSTPWSR